MKHVIGITGGISSGKSNICKLLTSWDFTVISCDQISIDLSKKGQPLYKAILESFGEEYLDETLELDRKKLGKRIFSNPSDREILNKITHPIIIKEMKRQIDEASTEYIFVEIPLLFEEHLEFLVDKIICAYLPKRIQIQRLMERDHIDKTYAKAKINSQISLKIKKKKSDYVIYTKGSFEKTERQLVKLIHKEII